MLLHLSFLSTSYTLLPSAKQFKKTRFIIFKISNLKIFPALISHRNKNYTDLLDELTDTSPAFICYDYEYMSKDGRPIDKMYCIYWKPENTSQSARIVYSQALHNFRTSLSGVENVVCIQLLLLLLLRGLLRLFCPYSLACTVCKNPPRTVTMSYPIISHLPM